MEYLKKYFNKIAEEYNGDYSVSEEIVGGIHGSALPFSKHLIKIPNGKYDISFYMEFGGTALATVNSKVENAFTSKTFQFKKRSPYLLLFSRNKKSLRVETKNENVRLVVEKLLVTTGLEKISMNSLFEPIIKFSKASQDLEIEMMFSMSFEDKEKVIRPVIEFVKGLKDYIRM